MHHFLSRYRLRGVNWRRFGASAGGGGLRVYICVLSLHFFSGRQSIIPIYLHRLSWAHQSRDHTRGRSNSGVFLVSPPYLLVLLLASCACLDFDPQKGPTTVPFPFVDYVSTSQVCFTRDIIALLCKTIPVHRDLNSRPLLCACSSSRCEALSWAVGLAVQMCSAHLHIHVYRPFMVTLLKEEKRAEHEERRRY